jgi:hypothetical protein
VNYDKFLRGKVNYLQGQEHKTDMPSLFDLPDLADVGGAA